MCEALKKLRDLGKLEMLFSLVEDGSLTVDRGADKIGMTLEEFKDSYEEWLKGKEKQGYTKSGLLSAGLFNWEEVLKLAVAAGFFIAKM